MPSTSYVRWFSQLGLGDVALVGGKTASLGELYNALAPKGINIPNGFGVTAQAYREALNAAGAWDALKELLRDVAGGNIAQLQKAAAGAREIVYTATGTDALRGEIGAAYRALEDQYGRNVPVAVRSSATAEDLPNASFAGQHDSFINVAGEKAVFEACRRCFASLFTDRAIVYRNDNRFDHFKVALSVAVMKMVRADSGASGVMFTLDTETGFRDVVMITGIYGLGENIVQGRVDPDEFYVHKPTFAAGRRTVLRHTLGQKQERMVFARRKNGPTTINRKVPAAQRERFCITDPDVLALAGYGIAVENHYSTVNARPTPMDIEWAKDGIDGKIYIVQARPETVASQRESGRLQTYTLTKKGVAVATGRAIGERIATGAVRIVTTERDLAQFRPGEILVAETTTPDWQPILKKAAGIVTDRGGRTCHAAIVARELGIPAVVGTGGATKVFRNGEAVTVSCAEGDIGEVYRGSVPFDVVELKMSELPRPRTRIMINLGDPDLAFRSTMLPSDGVGLARMEFIINEFIGVHPMALANFEAVTQPRDRRLIQNLVRNFERPQDYFIQRLSEGAGMIAAAFYPRPVIVRMSDFKTNEYAKLIGGAQFEPVESNPMLGFRGASRYAHPAYAAGFALECAALRRVREEMGLSNLKIMIPFCRREEEAARVLAAMASCGLQRGEKGLEIYVMCEIPNNVIRIDAFSKLFDGFSIGSNDLTQLTLGVDRDSETVAFDFDERDPGMKAMLRMAIDGAHRNARPVGICGEAPANYPDLAKELVDWNIDSISVNPSSVVQMFRIAAEAEERGAFLRRAANA